MRPFLPSLLASLVLAASTLAAQAAGVVNVYNWSDYLAEDSNARFSRQSGIAVRYDVYDSNEILRAKLMTGRSGYDVVVPSHNTLALGISSHLFRPLDKSKLPNLKYLDPAILKLVESFDPGHRYGVPNFWGFNTVGINVDKVKQALGGPLPANPWDLVFNPAYTRKLQSCGISVLDAPGEFFPVALHYFGFPHDSTRLADYQAVADKLTAVRRHYKLFSSSSYYNQMASGDLCVAMGFNGDFNLARQRAEEAKNGVKIQALIPASGMDLWVDMWAIPRDAANVDNAHAYINAMLDPQMAARNSNYVAYATGVLAARPYIQPALLNNPTIYPQQADLRGSFVSTTRDAQTIKGYTRIWQKLRSGH